MVIINVSQARANLSTVLDRVEQDADVTVITRRDAPDAVIMSRSHYDSLTETLHLLAPANAAHLGRSITQARNGLAKPRTLEPTTHESP